MFALHRFGQYKTRRSFPARFEAANRRTAQKLHVRQTLNHAETARAQQLGRLPRSPHRRAPQISATERAIHEQQPLAFDQHLRLRFKRQHFQSNRRRLPRPGRPEGIQCRRDKRDGGRERGVRELSRHGGEEDIRETEEAVQREEAEGQEASQGQGRNVEIEEDKVEQRVWRRL